MRYQFDQFILDTDCFEIHRNGQSLHSEPQVIELLALLVQNANRLVSRDEINEKVWRGRIVSEAALSSRIKTARQILGDNGRDQRFIRTVHKKGFRFVAAVEPLDLAPSIAQGGDLSAPGNKIARATRDRGAGQGGPVQPTGGTGNPGYRTEGNAAAPSRPTVAVMPFINLSDDPDQEYFSDGITADIVSHLSKHRWLEVTARNTTFGYKGKIIDLRRLGRELGVTYVVEGSVQRAGSRVRVSVHLVNAGTGLHMWSDRYDREITDLFAIQDEITEMVSARLEPEIGLAERNRVVLSRTENLQAWDYFHLGVHHFFRFTAEDNREAQRLLQRSTVLDGSFGDAWAWWAYALVLGMIYWDTPPTAPLLDDALAACNRALSLDSQNATFYALRGRIKLARCEYEGALQDNQMAITLNPTFAAAHCGLGDSLAYEGRYDEAVSRFEKAVALSPNDPQLWAFLTYGALAQLFRRDFETALQWTERAACLPNCQYWTTAHRVVALSYSGREPEAKQTAGKLLLENPGFNCDFVREKLFYLKMKEQVEFYLAGLRRAGIC